MRADRMARITAEERGAGAAGRVAADRGGRERARPRRRTRGRMSSAVWIAVAVDLSRSPRCSSACGTGTPSASRPTGPVLLVLNHISILDPLACARLVWDNGRVPHFLAKESVFRGPGGPLLRGAGQIPVARFTADAHEALHAAEADLAAGNVVVIYPEGSVTRDPDWWPMEARTGVARLALTTDAVVLPVAQWGPQRVHDYHAKKLHLRLRTPADYLVGEPVDLSAQRAQLARRAAADRRAAEGDDRPDHGPRARPAGRAARGARARRLPPAPAARAARRRCPGSAA